MRLGQVRRGTDPALAERYEQAARGVAVYSADAQGERRLRLRAAEIDPGTQAAVLRVDPITDREEFAELADLVADASVSALEALSGSDRSEARWPAIMLTSVVGRRRWHPVRPGTRWGR